MSHETGFSHHLEPKDIRYNEKYKSAQKVVSEEYLPMTKQYVDTCFD